MKRIIAVCAMVVAVVTSLPALAFCPQPPLGTAADARTRYFQATTLAMRQTQLGADAALAVTRSATPFDAVYALKSNLADIECAESAITPFAGSANKNIATSATLMLMSLRVLHTGAERALHRINASLDGAASLSQAQTVDESADDALKMKDALDNLFLSTTMATMLLKTCDPGAQTCTRLVLTDQQRASLSEQWVAMAKAPAGDLIAKFSDTVVRFLADPKFLSAQASPGAAQSK